MAIVFDKIWGGDKVRNEGTKGIAKNRIKAVLSHERANISPQFMEMIKKVLVESLSNYIDVDESAVVIDVNRAKISTGGRPEIVFSVPINNIKDVKK